MNIRNFKSVLLTGLTITSTAFLPALAADSSKPESTQGPVNSVRINQRHGHLVANGGSCERGGFRGMHRHHGLFGSLQGPLAVTNDQLEKIFAIKTQAAEEISPKIADMITASREMRAAMTEPNLDKSRVLEREAKINGDRDAIANVKVETKLNELAVLTPEQRQQIRQNFVKWSVERGGSRRG